jgi:hypothetical protein
MYLSKEVYQATMCLLTLGFHFTGFLTTKTGRYDKNEKHIMKVSFTDHTFISFLFLKLDEYLNRRKQSSIIFLYHIKKKDISYSLRRNIWYYMYT